MRTILITLFLFAGYVHSFAFDYSTIIGLKGAALEGAQILDSKYRLSRDSLQLALDMIRIYSESNSDAESHYLLGVIYSNESGRYGRFFDILSEEYNSFPIEPGYENEIDAGSPIYEYDASDPQDIILETLTSSYYRRGYGYYYTYIATRAFDEFLMAANKGYGPAINNVAYCYAKGAGVGQDSQKALEYYEKAAELGETSAYANLGVEYLFGGGIVDYNFDKAFYWLSKAYNNGVKTDYISLCLGFCYEKGYGTPVDIKKAVSIYESTSHSESIANALGLNVGNFSIPSRLAILYYAFDEVRDYDKAFQYLKFVADENVQEVGEVRGYILRCLSACYRFGRGAKANKELADFYLKKAGEHGNIDAQKALQFIDAK